MSERVEREREREKEREREPGKGDYQLKMIHCVTEIYCSMLTSSILFLLINTYIL